MKIHLDISCDADAAIARLQSMQNRSQDFRPVLRDARSTLEKANESNFATGGLPVGGWKPRTRDYAWPIMKRSGKLLSSLTNLRGNPNKIEKTEAEFGTSVEYAKFHQYGTERMPARKIVFNPTGFSEDLARKAAKWVVRGNF